MSFSKKPPAPPKVKIVVPDETGTTVSQEVELNLQSQEDLQRIMMSLTSLLDLPDRRLPEHPTSTESEQESALVEAALAHVATDRRELLRTALQLMELRKLSVSHVPGSSRQPDLYAALLALYTLESLVPHVTVGRLGETTGIPSPTLVRVLERLRAEGLLSQGVSNDDKRLTLLKLTDRARNMLDLFFSSARDVLRK